MPDPFVAAAVIAKYADLLAEPTFTVWNRLEGQPFSDDIGRSLLNEVRDPLWMLARQWQSGELLGEDAGSPLSARLAYSATPVDRLGTLGEEGFAPFGDEAPLEALVEAEPLPDDLLIGLRIGRLWSDALERTGAAELLAWSRERFPAAAREAPAASLAADLEASNAALRLWRGHALAERLVDGIPLLDFLRAHLGDRAAPDGLTDAAWIQAQAVGAEFLSAIDAVFVLPKAGRNRHWNPSRFEYGFTTGTELGETLVADQHTGTRLDWPSFDRVGPTPQIATEQTIGFLPQPVEFPGMPNSRWWEFEDRRIDLTALTAGKTDLAKLLFIEFGLVFGNDWFVVPLEVATGSLVRVSGVLVRDSFGEATFVPPDDQLAAREAATEASTLFALSDADGRPTADPALFLPPATAAELIGEPLDRLALLRDEMANLAWAVELTVPDRCGGGADGRAAAAALRAVLDPEADPLAGPGQRLQSAPPGAPDIRYRLATRAPDNWIPLVPAAIPGEHGQIRFQQGALLYNGGRRAGSKILPRGDLLASRREDLPRYIFEEEIPRSGVLVTRAFSRVRWHGGRTAVWLGREKRNGRGEGSSGLAYDGVVPQQPRG